MPELLFKKENINVKEKKKKKKVIVCVIIVEVIAHPHYSSVHRFIVESLYFIARTRSFIVPSFIV